MTAFATQRSMPYTFGWINYFIRKGDYGERDGHKSREGDTRQMKWEKEKLNIVVD